MYNVAMSMVEGMREVDSVARGALRSEITKRLLLHILEGRLPAGSRLVVQKLASRFGVSSTPVRESLVALEAAGLVRFLHNKGVVVRPFGRDQLREICQVRRILETEATRSACGRLDTELLEVFRRETLALDGAPRDADWSRRALATDMAIHQAIAAGCGNVRLAEEIRRYDTLVNTIAEVVGNCLEVQNRAIGEHLTLLEGLLSQNPDAAADAMARHINNTARDLDAIMFPAG